MGALHHFAERGDLDGVRRLLDSGVPVDALDESDETALHGAAAFGIPKYFGSCSSAGPPSIRPMATSSGPR